MPSVSAIAISRTFHNGRPSVMSYAALSVLMMDTIAPERPQQVVCHAHGRVVAPGDIIQRWPGFETPHLSGT